MSRYLSPKYQSLKAYVPGEQPRDMEYVKLNTNESPFPPAPEVVAAMTGEQVELLRLYSDPTGKGLKEKLAGLYGIQPQQVFLGNGSDDILNFAFMAFGSKGVAYPDISYGFYSVFADLHELDKMEIPLKEDFSVDYREYCGVNRLVVIANPNAPTGMSLPLDQIEEIVKTNPDAVVVIDEAYVDFGGISCYRLIDKYDNLLVVRTFSKSRSMAGGRLGFAMGSKELIDDLEKLKYSTNPYNINRLTLRLGEATVDADAYYQKMCSEIVRVREMTTEELKKMGFEVLPSNANFLFARHPSLDGEGLYLELKKRGVLVRHFTKQRISQFIRITVGTQKQMECCLNTIKSIMAGE